MAQLTRTHLRGLLIPDPRLTYDAAWSSTLSNATQAGPVPGEAVAQQDGFATLVATGTQSAGGALRLLAQDAGMPALGGAGIVWRNDGDTLYRGWDVPQTITGFDYVRYTTTVNAFRDPCVMRLADDGLVVAYEDVAGSAVMVARRAATATSWTQETVFSHAVSIGAAYVTGARPCMVQLPSGRLLVFYAVEDTASTALQVGMSYSDDSGDTWTRGQRYCLAASISTATTTLQRMRAAYLNGQIVLLLDLRDTSTAYYRRLAQYGSADLGATFSLVDQYSGADASNQGAYPDVVATSAAFLLAYVRYDGTRSRPRSRRIGSAFARFSTATEVDLQASTNPMSWGSYAAGDYTAGDLALAADDVGRVYAFGRDVSVAGLDDVAVRYTEDSGDTWVGPGSSSHQTTKAMLWRGEDSSTSPRTMSATWQRGRAVLATTHQSTGTTADASISVLFAGGWATAQLPALTSVVSHDTMCAWERTWLPFDLPQDTGTAWSVVTAGTPTITLGSTGLQITGATGVPPDSVTYTATPTGTMAQGVIAEVWVDVDSGLATLKVRAGVAGPDSFEASITVSPTAVTLLDVTGASTIATVSTTAGTSGVWIRLAVGCPSVSGNNGRCAAWYAPGSRGDTEDRAWIPVGASQTLVQGTDTTHRVQFISGTGGFVAFSHRWRWAAYTSGAYAGTALTQVYSGQANPGDLLPREVTGEPVYIADGVSVAGTDGPLYRNDAWNIDADYRYPVRAVHVEQEPSPRRAWRSTTDASEQIIAWELTSTLASASPFLAPDRCLYLGNVNFRTAYWEGRDTFGAWQTIATIDTATGQNGLGYYRDGSLVRARSALGTNAIGRILTENELAGAYFSMAGGTRIRPISTSTAGTWPNPNSSGGQITRCIIGAIASDPVSGTDGAVLMPNVAIIAAETSTLIYSAYRLRIPAQTTHEGYFRVGVLVQGRFYVFGQQYSQNRGQEMAPAYELTEARGGARRVQRTGPSRRAVEIAWDEGVDGSALARNGDDWVQLHNSGDPVAMPADVTVSMLGLLDELGGAVTPVVYLPSVQVMSGGTTVRQIVTPPLMLYGRIRTETLRVDTVQGNEYDSPGEVYRVARVRIEEEL